MEQTKKTPKIIIVARWGYLIASLIVGAIAGTINVFLYSALKYVMPRPVLFAMLITLFTLMVSLTIFVIARVSEWQNTARGRHRKISDSFFERLEGGGWLFVGLIIALVVLFVTSMLFEWLYEIEKREELQSSSYIFVLDESSSMDSWNRDPHSQRYTAVSTVMAADKQNLPYAVYMFATDCVRIRDMAPYAGETLQKPAAANEGFDGTSIMNALYTVYGDLTSGTIEGGEHPQIILLTDGKDGNDYLIDENLLDACKNAGICISAITMGNADEGYLSQITDATGGLLLRVSNAEELTDGFYELSVMANRRDLISPRRNVRGDWLYMLLRLVMLMVIGSMIALIKLIALGDEMHVESLLVSLICIAIGALIVEFCIRGPNMTLICQMFYWLLLSPMYWSVEHYSVGDEIVNGTSAQVGGSKPGKSGRGSGSRPGKGRQPSVDISNF